MAIAVRGTSNASVAGGTNYTIVPPAGTQPGDLLAIIYSETAFTVGSMSNWTIAGTKVAFFDGMASQAEYRIAEDPVPATYTVIKSSGNGAAHMIALYSTEAGGDLSVADIAWAAVEAEDPAIERPPSPTFEVPDITAGADGSLLLALLARLKLDEFPEVPTGMSSESTYNSSTAQGDFRTASLAVDAGATGTKYIASLDSTQNSAVAALVITETITATPEVVAISAPLNAGGIGFRLD